MILYEVVSQKSICRSLRYRLRCVVNPVRKWDGCLLPALTGFLLVMSYGLLSFVPG